MLNAAHRGDVLFRPRALLSGTPHLAPIAHVHGLRRQGGRGWMDGWMDGWVEAVSGGVSGVDMSSRWTQ